MNDTLSTSLIFCICAIACAFLCQAVWRWRENRNNERISPGFKLLRGPGESLQRRIAAIDDKLFSQLSALLVFPLALLTGAVAAYVLSDKAAFDSLVGDMIPYVVPLLLAHAIYSMFKVLRLLSRRRDFYLGYFGERVVSENIDILRTKGTRIFHDVPLRGGGDAVNIDHVIVAPAGIFAVETKTRRKGRVLEGRADGKIVYDGAQLAYPWGEDTHGLSQAATRALWLDKAIDKTGLPGVTVQPVLTFPGWRVEQTETASASAVRVLTPAQIPLHLDTLPPHLSASQIKHIAQQLETLCRDVEF